MNKFDHHGARIVKKEACLVECRVPGPTELSGQEPPGQLDT